MSFFKISITNSLIMIKNIILFIQIIIYTYDQDFYIVIQEYKNAVNFFEEDRFIL